MIVCLEYDSMLRDKSSIYQYIHGSIATHFNDKQIYQYIAHQTRRRFAIINCDFTNGLINFYCIMEPIKASKNGNYGWKMVDKLFANKTSVFDKQNMLKTIYFKITPINSEVETLWRYHLLYIYHQNHLCKGKK